MPANTLALVMLGITVTALVRQPDFGQTMLIALVWGALFFMAGMRVVWVIGLAGTAAAGLTAAYFTVPYVMRRIQRFLDPASGDTFQIDTAIDAFRHGGWFGRGPGEGTVKRYLPDAHADFVFAVAAEEFGIVLCLIMVALFCFIVVRALTRAMRCDDPFARFGTAGLAILFGAQSAINMAVNLSLIPAKGMTLPFISYGGSSIISLAYGMGMLLALSRERPRAELIATRGGAGARRQPGLMSEAAAQPLVVVAAGGTGGHLFPAEALAVALAQRGVTVDLATDERAVHYGHDFPARETHIIPSATLRTRDLASLAPASWRLVRGAFVADRLFGRLKPAAVIGFGGYPTIPPLLAAAFRRIPTLIHEQNGVMGRANKLLGAAGARDRDQPSRRARSRPEARRQGDPHRQSGAAGGDRGRQGALRGARPAGAAQSPGVRRQPGRAHHGRHRAAGGRAAAGRRARQSRGDPAGARRGCRARARDLRAARRQGRDRAVLSRPAGAHRRRAIWW